MGVGFELGVIENGWEYAKESMNEIAQSQISKSELRTNNVNSSIWDSRIRISRNKKAKEMGENGTFTNGEYDGKDLNQAVGDPMHRPKRREREHLWTFWSPLECDEELIDRELTIFDSLKLRSWFLWRFVRGSSSLLFRRNVEWEVLDSNALNWRRSSQMQPDEPCLLKETDDLCSVVININQWILLLCFFLFFVFFQRFSLLF